MVNQRHTWQHFPTAFRGYSMLGKLQLLLSVLFICTITTNQKVSSTFLFIWLVSLAVDFKITQFKKALVPIIIFSACFLLSLLSVSYSDNFREAKMTIERQLVLMFLPLLFFSAGNTPDKTKISIVFTAFYVTMVSICIYLDLIFYSEFRKSNTPVDEWFVKEHLYHAFAEPVNMHATFLSLYLAMALFVGFYRFIKPNGWLLNTLIGLCNLVLITTLTLLASRVVIISVLLILIFVYPFFIQKLKYKISLIFMALVMLLVLYGLMSESTFIKDRFAKKIGEEVRMTSFLNPDSTYKPIYGGETRADRWYCAAELIKERPLLGYGAGEEKAQLMNKYQKYNLQNAVINNYDAHNQYLSYGIKTGFIGMAAFLLSIAYAIYMAIKQRSFLYLALTVLFAFTCITENVLESNKGIFFYAFFNTMLYAYYVYGRNAPITEDAEKD